MKKLFKATAFLVATGATVALGVMSLPKIKQAINGGSDEDLLNEKPIIDVEVDEENVEKIVHENNDSDIVEEVIDNSTDVVEEIKTQVEDVISNTNEEVKETKVKLKDLSRIAKRRMESFSGK